jgi:hypothetical protein
MPKTLYIGGSGNYSGITIEYIKSKKLFYISGFYDSCVGIEGKYISLKEFIEYFGITLKDINNIFKGK